MKKQVNASSYTTPRDTTILGSVPAGGVGGRAPNSWRDMGRSDVEHAAIAEQYVHIQHAATPSCYILGGRTQRDKPLRIECGAQVSYSAH